MKTIAELKKYVIILEYKKEKFMSKKRKFLILSGILLLLSIVYTILVKIVDVANIGPMGSSVGFSTLNKFVHQFIGSNMLWYDITKYLGILAFLFVGIYAFLGVKDFISKKKLANLDKTFYILGLFYIIFVFVYILFEIAIINYRPILIEGELEASYPSSHTLLALCICGSSIIVSKYLIKNQNFRKYLNIASWFLMISIIVGRIISGVHWASDILGGLIIGSFLLCLLKTTLIIVKKEEEL